MLYYLMDNQFFHVLKMLHFPVCVILLTKISNFPKWSCMLNCCSECPGIFVPDKEINCGENVNLLCIFFITIDSADRSEESIGY